MNAHIITTRTVSAATIARTAVLAASKVVQQQMSEESAQSVVDRVLEEVKAK